jgi:hypothetical protein
MRPLRYSINVTSTRSRRRWPGSVTGQARDPSFDFEHPLDARLPVHRPADQDSEVRQDRGELPLQFQIVSHPSIMSPCDELERLFRSRPLVFDVPKIIDQIEAIVALG